MDNHIFSKRVSAGTRIYYVDVRKDSKESHYLVISEIPTSRANGKQKRQRIFIHHEHLDAFNEALNAAIEHIKNGETN